MDEFELVDAARLGDREAFAVLYDRYADLVYDYCRLGQTDEDAERATAVVFEYAASSRFRGLDDPARFRAWLLGLAQSIMRRWREQRPLVVLDDLPSLGGEDPGPEARRIVEAAIPGLERDDRELLALYLVELGDRIERPELVRARGLTRDASEVRIERLRERLDKAIIAVVLARQGRQACAALEGIVASLHGMVSPQLCKRVYRHSRECEVCAAGRELIDAEAIVASVPYAPAPIGLRQAVLERMALAAPALTTRQGPLAIQGRPAAGAARPARARKTPYAASGWLQLFRIAAVLVIAAMVSLAVWFPGRARTEPPLESFGALPAGGVPPATTGAVPATQPAPTSGAPTTTSGGLLPGPLGGIVSPTAPLSPLVTGTTGGTTVTTVPPTSPPTTAPPTTGPPTTAPATTSTSTSTSTSSTSTSPTTSTTTTTTTTTTSTTTTTTTTLPPTTLPPTTLPPTTIPPTTTPPTT